MSTLDKTFNFHLLKVLRGKDQTAASIQNLFLLMHPSTMKTLQYCKGSFVLVQTERGQLLFRCSPCISLELSAIMLHSVNFVHYYSEGPVICSHYPLFIKSADMIILNCDCVKLFMKTQCFKRFIRRQLDHIYLREGLILNISYLGYPCCFTVKKIVNQDGPEINFPENSFDICTGISSLNISEDNLEDSIDERSFICSTPISSKQSSNNMDLYNQNKKYVKSAKNSVIHKPQQFYSVHRQTNIKVHNSREIINSSNRITLQHLGGLKEQVDEVKVLVQSIINQDSLHEEKCYGIILVGTSGTGKSTVVEAVGNEFHLPVFRLNSVIADRNEKEYKYQLKQLFDEAVDNSPSILFLDNIDEFYKNSESLYFHKESKLVHLLSTMIYDLLSSVNDVLVIAATRNISFVDASLRKPGTLEKEIYFEMPSIVDRKEILGKILLRKHHNLTDKQIREISEKAHGFTGGDLKLLCDKADISSTERTYDTDACITFEDLKEALKNTKPSSMTEFLFEVPNIKWSDIGGMHAVKTAITEMVEWPLKLSEQFKKLKLTPSKGILLYGPPGCSKTMIAKALVSESHLNFISIKGPQLFNKYVGESEKAVSELFKKARSATPCVLFFDEIDSLTSTRGSTGGNSNVAERILIQLLVEIDGIDVLQGVSIIAATNRPDMIDPSILRPGRFDQMIYVPLPDSETRKEIFEAKLKNMPCTSDIDISYLVLATDGYTGAEITDICREAAMSGIKDYITSSSTVVTMFHFLNALKSVVPRTSKETIQFYENFNKRR